MPFFDLFFKWKFNVSDCTLRIWCENIYFFRHWMFHIMISCISRKSFIFYLCIMWNCYIWTCSRMLCALRCVLFFSVQTEIFRFFLFLHSNNNDAWIEASFIAIVHTISLKSFRFFAAYIRNTTLIFPLSKEFPVFVSHRCEQSIHHNKNNNSKKKIRNKNRWNRCVCDYDQRIPVSKFAQ